MPEKKYPRNTLHHAHDAVFKAFFSDVKIAQKYLLHYTAKAVYQHIDFTFFRKIDTAFTSSRFGISFSDVLYETRLVSGASARIIFLFEHKSFLPSQSVHLQLLDYLLQIWEDDLKNERPLSVIIPIVVYHGKQPWKYKPFPAYFKGLPNNWQAFVPDFHYWLTDLSQITPQEIEEKTESEYLKNLFLSLKLSHDKGSVLKNWPNILTFGESEYRNDREGILLQTLTLYIFNLFAMTDTQVKTLNEHLPEPERDWIDAIPEIFGEKWKKKGLREGRKEGRKEGRIEGKIEGKIEGRQETALAITCNMLRKFPEWSDNEIAEIVDVDVTFVQNARQKLTEKGL
ncbi:MAG: Rpn family recombination-promoting nuclease/putative transposase [Lewinellaceae bacterium]|nr:Rpn family recombination-promoting nuclease/putative transposase [Lewinellaceae bacterium]